MKTYKLEVRKAKTKKEREMFGSCLTEGDKVMLFINEEQNASQGFNTYIHELTHAYFHMTKARLTYESQEAVCKAVGEAAEQVFTQFFKLR